MQGVSVALALAYRGYPSTLIEKNRKPLAGASYGNEGKIHLGLVYALDDTLKTGVQMLKGAYSFAPLLDRWCGPLPWHRFRTNRFYYANMQGSLASGDQLASYYNRLSHAREQVLDELHVNPSYIGTTPDWFFREVKSSRPQQFDACSLISLYDTEEVAVDTRLLLAELRREIAANPLIDLQCDTHLEYAERSNSGYTLHTLSQDEKRTLASDIVINCTWADLHRIDSMIVPGKFQDELSYRVKYRVMAKPLGDLSHLQPVTMVQGPFGDFVPFQDGSVYLSWYPLCRTYLGNRPPIEEIASPDELARVASTTLEKFADLFPYLRNAVAVSTTPCTIVAKGKDDIDSPESALHQRSECGPIGRDGWWSIDTGKLTTAPLFGEIAAEAIVAEIES